MTKFEIEAVFDRVRAWPEARQRDVVAILTEMERQGTDAYDLTDEERADLEEGLRQADQGEFASEEEVATIFAKHRG